jgi:hypothetical protein
VRLLCLVVLIVGCDRIQKHSPSSPPSAKIESSLSESESVDRKTEGQLEVSLNKVRKELSELEITHPKAVTRSGAQLIVASRKKEMLGIFLDSNRTSEEKYASVIHLMNVFSLTGDAEGLKGYLKVIEGSFRNFDHSWYFPEITLEYSGDPAGGSDEITKELEIIRLGLSLLPAKSTGDAERRRMEMKNYLLKREAESMEKLEKLNLR